MAEISLIPKSQKEKALPRFRNFRGPRFKINAWTKLGLALFLVLIIVAAGLFIWNRSLSVEEGLLQKEFTNTRKERDASLEKEISNTGILLNSFDELIKNHRNWSQLLEMIDEKVMVGISFVSFEGNYELGTFSLKGISPNYNLIAQQIKSFEKQSNISQVDVSNIRLNREGKVEFLIKADFKKSLIKKLSF